MQHVGKKSNFTFFAIVLFTTRESYVPFPLSPFFATWGGHLTLFIRCLKKRKGGNSLKTFLIQTSGEAEWHISEITPPLKDPSVRRAENFFGAIFEEQAKMPLKWPRKKKSTCVNDTPPPKLAHLEVHKIQSGVSSRGIRGMFFSTPQPLIWCCVPQLRCGWDNFFLKM